MPPEIEINIKYDKKLPNEIISLLRNIQLHLNNMNRILEHY